MMRQLDKRRKAVLIIECDTTNLAKKSLDIGSSVQFFFRLAYPQNPIQLISTSTDAALRNLLDRLVMEQHRYSHIILIGHSNNKVIQLCSDRQVPWTEVAQYFARFEPKKLFLVGCCAGRWLPCKQLFDTIDSLDEIYGSPIPVTISQSLSILFMVLHSLGVKRPDVGLLRLIQFASFVMTHGLMFRKTRGEFRRDGFVNGLLWTAGEQALQEMFK